MTDFDLEQRIESGYYRTKKPYALSDEQFNTFHDEIDALDSIPLTISDRKLKKKEIIQRKKNKQSKSYNASTTLIETASWMSFN
jgi:hypothetical protein